MRDAIERAWRRVALDGFGAVAEALYPASDTGAPTWREAEMVPRAARWLEALPPSPRHLIMLLFTAAELGAPILAPGLGRLSRLPPARRLAMVRRLRTSPLPPLKLMGDGLKQATSMIYLSHPDVLRHIGAYKTCEHPDDSLPFPVRREALAGLTP